MSERSERMMKYVHSTVATDQSLKNLEHTQRMQALLVKAMNLLPVHEQDMFLSGARTLSIEIIRDPKIPFGMKTRSSGSKESREYTISICRECVDWTENRFLGAILRELGHVVAGLSPEEEWPELRGDRARFKEHVELVADCMVWKWGLRHYNMSYLTETFQPHWVDRIVKDIELLLESDQRFKNG